MLNDKYSMIAAALAAAWALASPALSQECAWSALGDGVDGWYQEVYAMTTFDAGAGPALYAGGSFLTAGGASANGVARWDGQTWSALGSGVSGGGFSVFPAVHALTVFDDGAGPTLYAGGNFERAGGDLSHCIAKWNGEQWSAVGELNSIVRDIAVFDDGTGPALYAAGVFTMADGAPVGRIAKWDGEQWHALGTGLDAQANALAVFDDGGGPALYAGGRFTMAGGEPALRIARWDGSSWSALGSGLDGLVMDLAVYDDGAGEALYAAGFFTEAGGTPASGIAKWNGTAWSPVDSGVTSSGDASVWAMAVFDDGAGPALYATGGFQSAGGRPAANFAKWDGAEWSAVGGGLNSAGFSLGAFDIGAGDALYVGGQFVEAGGVEVNRIARLDCEPTCYADCDGDGELTFFDFLCFQNLFAAMDPAADCDGDGEFTFFDFLCFQNAFAAGCP